MRIIFFIVLNKDQKLLNPAKPVLPTDTYNCGRNEVCVISMSLFGSNPQYTLGAVENAKIVRSLLPSWKLRIYIPGQNTTLAVPQIIIEKLKEYDADIHVVNNYTIRLNPRMWRFMVADDLHTDRFIIRDTDSRIFKRDVTEINEWIRSGKIFHCIRDHPLHGNYPILGGMWGAETKGLKKLLAKNFSHSIARYGQNKFADQQFLKREIWPKVQNNTYCSDSFFCYKFPNSHPFQTYRSNDLKFIGEIFDVNGKRIPQHISMLNNMHEDPRCSPKLIT